ncbi:MAG: DUF92 domain-containing protein [Gammaproteobacteria bacterium]|nr:DUF92 domain-containing protein [Gammaproteobacteria bacterium]
MSLLQFSSGFVLAALVCTLAWRVRGLSSRGAVAATLVGGLIFGLGGWQWAVLLLGFFISSSMLSHAVAARKKDLNEKSAKGAKRDGIQVLANGGVAALLALLQSFNPEQIWPWIAYAGSMAAVNADTWATELGVLNRSPPRMITTGRPVARGISGGITLVGTLATLGGALLIALLSGVFDSAGLFGKTLLVITAAGVAGSLFDSFLGATLQAIYHCPHCTIETEHHPLHNCGESTTRIRGWPWINNDMVNFLNAIFGAAVALVLWHMG